MHPELFTLPIIGVTIKAYGFCLMVGFLSAVWLAMRRAQRVKADPDKVLDMSFLALIFGVGGARLFYVVHYWQAQFAQAPNRFLAVVNITEGGLEFLGGFLGAFLAIAVYGILKRKELSLRLYLDILAPGVMWGMAFARLGCFLNGCCFGGACLSEETEQVKYAWAIEFPFASPAQWRQWEDRRVTVPAELITTDENLLQPNLMPAALLSMSVERREKPVRTLEESKRKLEQGKAQALDAAEIAKLEAAVRKARRDVGRLILLGAAQRYPSRIEPLRRTSVTELEQLAAEHKSIAVHPTQLYSSIHGLLLSGVLAALFYVRKRHGVVIGALLVMYPIPRFLLEIIRADNPPDVVGLTASQSVSLGLLVIGIVYLIILYKRLPERAAVLQ